MRRITHSRGDTPGPRRDLLSHLMRALAWVTAVTVWLWPLAAAQGTVWAPQEECGTVRQATLIALGETIDEQVISLPDSEHYKHLIGTLHRIRVLRPITGDVRAGEILSLWTLGAKDGTRVFWVPGISTLLATGQRLIVFLRPAGPGPLVPDRGGPIFEPVWGSEHGLWALDEADAILPASRITHPPVVAPDSNISPSTAGLSSSDTPTLPVAATATIWTTFDASDRPVTTVSSPGTLSNPGPGIPGFRRARTLGELERQIGICNGSSPP